MQRPVWLLSLDSDTFPAAPTTTGGLKAYYQKYGQQASHTDIQLVHFANQPERIAVWLKQWADLSAEGGLAHAQQAIKQGLQPIIGFSVYTWNAAEFLAVMAEIKKYCPEILIIVGGPHVQKAEDYLFSEAVDVVFMGEAEATLTDFLDTSDSAEWDHILGLAFVRNNELVITETRPRFKELDLLPSALDVISLQDEEGKPYDSIAYETTRGCPYKCAFCEWGTGAIGTKMLSYSLERIRSDWNRIVDAGIRNIWLSDSNFGALKQDMDKTKLLCEIKERTGLPHSFATSWSKKHGPRSQEMVLMLHKHDLLPHYHLALQTLTPLALKLSNRTNMAANKYEPIARDMAKARIPIACELIWGLIGDNLSDFENNLNRLYQVFPTIHIFGYTLLPGTEFYERREEYEIKTLPVAGYGKAKGEYVVGCKTFSAEEGIEGYFLITAHMLFNRGYMLPMTLRYLALLSKRVESISVPPLMREILHGLCEEFSAKIPELDVNHKMGVYEVREKLFVTLYEHAERSYRCAEKTIQAYLDKVCSDKIFTDQQTADLKYRIHCMVSLDKAFAPRVGATREVVERFSFDAAKVQDCLSDLDFPEDNFFAKNPIDIHIHVPGGVGDVIKDPDGGLWIHGERIDKKDTDLNSAAAETIAISA